MKKKLFLISVCLLFCLSMFTGCEPAVMFEKIEADYHPKPLQQGTSSTIEIVYPLSESNLKWTDQKIEILDGSDIVEISGFSVKGLKKGTALIEVSATAHVPLGGIIVTKVPLSTELEIQVE